MNSFEEEKESLCVITAACAATIYKEEKGKNKCKRKRMWTRDIFLNRETRDAYSLLLQEMRLKGSESFRQYLRVSTDVFQVFDLLAIFFFNAYRIKGMINTIYLSLTLFSLSRVVSYSYSHEFCNLFC